MLSGLARQTGPQEFAYTGQAKTYHSFVDFARDYTPPALEPALLRKFLPGSFIFELKGKRKRELLETPEACELRLAKCG